MFQSTRPRGARPGIGGQRFIGYLVSIHAPAWDATVGEPHERRKPFVSIHAPAWDATKRGKKMRRGEKFQSTRPRGTRPIGIQNRMSMRSSFNPRARVGRDPTITHLPKFFKVSIHAPAWDATVFRLWDGLRIRVSIHAPAWDATRGAVVVAPTMHGFNPRARVGRD